MGAHEVRITFVVLRGSGLVIEFIERGSHEETD
jgi:hypothetical protein